MSGGRKPGGVSFRVIEGGRELHRQPVVPQDDRPPCVGCWIVASAVVSCVLALGVWIAATARWGRL